MTAIVNVKVKKLSPEAIIPKYESAGAAAFDLRAASLGWGHQGLVIGTGLSFEIPAGHVMMIYSRSGQGFNHGVTLANGTGVIDSDYRGEVKVKLTCESMTTAYEYLNSLKVGDRVAQAIVMPIPTTEFSEVDELSETVRGAAGFGSTGQ